MNNKNNLSIAKRYAKSLLELMIDGENKIDEVSRDLDNVKTILQNSSDLYSAMTNPIVSAYDKEQIINAVFEQDTNLTVRNFLKLLVDKNRFNLIYSIIDVFKEMLNKINNIAKVDIVCAIELDENRKNEIQNKLSQKLNKQIEISYNIDNSIIAGLIFKIEDNVLDTSFIHKLEEFKKELIKN